MRILTIGGYGFTERTFIATLTRAHVDVFVDVRQRRGMRGSKYAFLNSKRLQELLREAGIRYVYAQELAPTSAVRDAQKLDDRAVGTAKRDRSHLSPAFIHQYRGQVLNGLDPEPLRNELKDAKAIALFCVEGPPAACHRSLAAEFLVSAFHISEAPEHLRP